MSDNHIDLFFKEHLSDYTTTQHTDWSTLQTKMQRKTLSVRLRSTAVAAVAMILLFWGWKQFEPTLQQKQFGKVIYPISNLTTVENTKPVFVAKTPNTTEKNMAESNKTNTTVVIKRTVIVRDTLRSAKNK